MHSTTFVGYVLLSFDLCCHLGSKDRGFPRRVGFFVMCAFGLSNDHIGHMRKGRERKGILKASIQIKNL